jgi:hypothetical protein
MRKLAAIAAALTLALLPATSRANIHTFPSVNVVYPLVNRVAFTSFGLTSAAYATAASVTLTLGTSNGPTGAWDVEVEFNQEWGASRPTTFAACIIGTSAGTNAAGSYDQLAPAVCHSSPANALAGEETGPTQLGTSVPIVTKYSAQYANGATVAFTCQSFSSGAGVSVGGYCIERAWPI